MNSLVKLALLSERLYQDASVDDWLWFVREFWRESVGRNMVSELQSLQVLDLTLDHVGALVALIPDAASELLLNHGYTDIRVRESTVMAGILGQPVKIVEGRSGEYRVEFFCPERRGLATNRETLVNNWGRLGYGVHVGFRAPDRESLFKSMKALCLGNFIAPGWASDLEGRRGLVYLDGYLSGQRIRVEIFTC